MKKFYLTVLLVFLFRMTNAQYTRLLNFTISTSGANPYGDLYFDGTFLYGTAMSGGASNNGTLYKIKPNGTGYLKLLDFMGTTNGSHPYGGLISDGTYLYGTTSTGGANSRGTIFKILPNGTGYVDLLDFAGASNGQNPYGNLYYDGTFLYGTATSGGASNSGVLFKIKTDGSSFSKLLDFQPATYGSYPQGCPISDGTYLYGMTEHGGTGWCSGWGCGT